jgi:hypothetical protein
MYPLVRSSLAAQEMARWPLSMLLFEQQSNGKRENQIGTSQPVFLVSIATAVILTC